MLANCKMASPRGRGEGLEFLYLEN